MLHAKVLISTILFCSIQLLNAELVCHYDFEDSSWANRAAGSGFPDAAAKGGASFYFDEIRGSCADLTGQGWLQGGNQAGQFDALNIQLALTIWVKSSQNNWSDNNRLLGRGDYWGLEVVDNSVAGFFIKGGPLLRGKTNINDNKWHHIAACWNSQTGQRTLYVDGRLESEDIFSKKGHIEEWSWGYFSVGGRSSGYSAADKIYGGYVDDVRVYNKTLDTDEINKIFKAPVSLVRPVLPFHSKPRTPQEQALWREQRAKEFFTKLDLTVPGLRQVAYAVRKNDYQRAVDAAVRYFEGKNYRGFSLSPSSNWQSVAKDALEDRYNFAGFERKLERNEYGRIVWDSDAGTASDQYAAMLSRHYYMADILKAYKQTSQQQYLDLFNSLLRDWLDNNDYPKDEIEKTEKGKWAVPSTTQWVSLNAAIRLTSWISFWAGWDGVDVDDDVKFDMLMSIPEHCDFLRWHHRHDGNFKISEMKAICEAAIAFPEFKNASDWLEYGLDELSKEIDVQFYPDGAQKELAFHYNRIVVSKFSSIAKLAQANNIEIPSDFVARLENLYLYMAQVMKPNGYGLLNNDSDQEYIRDYVKDAASDYDNDQMRYIASAGQAGSWEKDAYSGPVRRFSATVLKTIPTGPILRLGPGVSAISIMTSCIFP
jgi:hypothetical protein